jgi:hypothetical protein
MNELPPPDPTQEPIEMPPSTSRRRLALAAVAATALGVGGVIAGSQLAAADDEVPEDDTVEEPADDETVEEPVDEEPADEDAADDDPADEEPVDEEPADDDRNHPWPDHADGEWEFPDLGELGELIDFDELGTAFEEFDACLSEQLPDLEDGGWIDIDGEEWPEIGDWDATFDDLVGGSVTVFAPGADGQDLTFLDFGEGDGTITITQTDGEIDVSTEGDVESIDAALPVDLPDFDIEPDPEFDAALEECEALLPDGGIFEMVGDLMDTVVVGDED